MSFWPSIKKFFSPPPSLSPSASPPQPLSSPASSLNSRSPADLAASVLENLSEGVVVVDSRHKILFSNKTAARWMNRSPSQALGVPLWEALRNREVGDMVGRALSHRSAESREIMANTPVESIWKVSARPYLAGEALKGAMVTFQDISELKRLEKIRRDFVANVSHELRTPLTALRAALETLLGGALEDKAFARDFLQTAHAQVERLHRLIEDLLVLSRLDQADSKSASAGRAPLRTSLEKVIKALSPMASKENVTIDAHWPDREAEAAISPDNLSQIAINLLDNAIKFNRPGGSVRVSLKIDGQRAEIEVRDSGTGILPEDLPRIFERFFRGDKARSSERPGTGLGLAIAKHIAENAGGTIRAESIPGQGSAFFLSLPLLP